MKKLWMIGTMAALMPLAYGQNEQKEAAGSAPAGKQDKARVEAGAPPAGAELIAPNTYRSKDEKGAMWIYRRAPFGWSKARENDATPAGEAARAGGKDAPAAVPATAAVPGMYVSGVLGETVTFEKASPFGRSRWSKLRSELSPEEKILLDRYEQQFVKATPAGKN